MAAFQQIMNTFPDQQGSRRLFGVSWPDGQGSLVYKAAIEESYRGRRKNWDWETYLLRKGEYLSLVVHNFMEDIPSIASLSPARRRSRVHPDTIGVEEYVSSSDVRCMVPCSWKQSLPEINNLAAG